MISKCSPQNFETQFCLLPSVKLRISPFNLCAEFSEPNYAHRDRSVPEPRRSIIFGNDFLLQSKICETL